MWHFVAQTWPQYDLSFRSKPEVEWFLKIISHEPQKIFLQSLHHLKDLSLYYILYTDMTLIWPSPSGRKTDVHVNKNIRKYYSVCIVYTQFPRKGPVPHTQLSWGSSLQSSRPPNWTPCVHVAVYSLLSSRIQHHGCEFCRETWEIHIWQRSD